MKFDVRVRSGIRFVFLSCSVLIVASIYTPSRVEGQLIGNRTVGTAPGFNQPRSSRTSQNVTNPSSPSISGRFVRGNRSRNDFVGSNRTDQQGFVGSTQAIGVGRVQSATEGLRVPNQRTVNRPLPAQPANGMYYPKLEIDSPDSVDPSMRTMVDNRMQTALELTQSRISKIAGDRVNIVRIGGLAIVRGTVPTQSVADLILNLLEFEPGIDQVKNELIIEDSSSRN